ncbi:MAG TPA: hypothetical protein VMU01_02140 [Rhizomicrobium sp.]|nr:hypothetical protein [Rhizomicrobium sp.]
MFPFKFAFAACAALLLASPVLAADAPAGAPPGHGMMRGMFTPEERMMLMSDAFKAMAGMTDEQRHAYRQQQRDRIMAMSDEDRAKFKADLDARWNALPADQKAALQAKVQAFIAARRAAMGSGGASAQ